MPESIEATRQCIARCLQLRNQGNPEAVLRQEFTSWLRRMFPDGEDESWIHHYVEGAETGIPVGTDLDTTCQRFIDTLVRSTVIEYEPDLRVRQRFEGGYSQVREYIAGAVRSGIPIALVRGILSDTVEWYVYEPTIVANIQPENCRPDDITLNEAETLLLSSSSEAVALQFAAFLRNNLARQQSRRLNADNIATDLGLDSFVCGRHLDSLFAIVDESRSRDQSAMLATELWSQFVDHIERTTGGFRTEAYVDELYIAVLARLLCANVLEGRALICGDPDMGDILTGKYFEESYNLRNMVEQDYFGWAWRRPHIEKVLAVAQEIQRDLYAYDFSDAPGGDIFGSFLAELSQRSQRKLLGQEQTPRWLAKQLAEKSVEILADDEVPRFVDVCCGSGSIIAEVLEATKAARPGLQFDVLRDTITGFDIDPLAVLLAKTTWVIALKEEISTSTDDVAIPVYHADSLFAVTPITQELPMPGEDTEVDVRLDGEVISLPALLIDSEYLHLFDRFIDWAYDEAQDAQLKGNSHAVTQPRVRELVDNLVNNQRLEIEADTKEKIEIGLYALAKRIADLAVVERNGIWAFILRNTYRPGLLAGQFNGLVTNPPWMAMSQIANNPYKEQLTDRAEIYGIKPTGAAFPHLELSTTHLLHAVDRYLRPGAAVACLLPGTILKGQHHAKFRESAYLDCRRPVPFELHEVWSIAKGTFKNRAAAVVGVRQREAGEVDRSEPTGALASHLGLQEMPLTLVRLGGRTAWVLGESSIRDREISGEVPNQGADLMPRTAVCIEVRDRRGSEWRVETPSRGDNMYSSVKGAKKLIGMVFRGSVAPIFIHCMVQSNNLLPFVLDHNFVDIAIPARKNERNHWDIVDNASIRTMGYTRTSRRFQGIDRAMADEGMVRSLREQINWINKLTKQEFASSGYLVLHGAGGSIPCAALLSLVDNDNIVIDQTLYWTFVPDEKEAWYRVGLMNTDALNDAIREFNPEGEFGPRHPHTLPSLVVPDFDTDDMNHTEVSDLALQISRVAASLTMTDERIASPDASIAARRSRLRSALMELPEYAALEDLAAIILEVRAPA